ncbi:MAG TPA: S9 family peptidase, partial [Anaeromyxobacteraceae bacterium]|nr:S9 family peptidase [Anaeromyxobacteraceae bacterium]
MSAALAAALALAVGGSPLPPLPPTPKRPVVDRIQGVEVKDDYRWLEDGASPEVAAWSAAQDARTRAWLSRLPAAAAIRARARELVATAPARYQRLREAGGALFALKHAPPLQQPLVVILPPGADPAAERVVVDPNAIDPSGATTIDFFVPSPDGALVAVSLSRNGTEDGTLHVYEAATGRERPDRIARVNGGTAGGSVAWDAGGAGFWYTRYPRDGERPAADLPFFQQVWYHRLGAPEAEDAYALGKDYEDPRIAESALQSSDDGRFTLCLVEKGDGGEFEAWLRGPWGGFARLAATADGVFGGRFGPDGTLWLLSRKDAP